MATRFIFSAMAHQGNRATFGQLLDKAQSKLLPVVFDRKVFPVNRPSFKKFLAVKTVELKPADFVGLYISQ